MTATLPGLVPLADPGVRYEVRLVPAEFARVFGRPAEGARQAPAGCRLLDSPGVALAVPLEWGATVAYAARGDGDVVLRHELRPAEAPVTVPGDGSVADVPDWARPFRDAVHDAWHAGLRGPGADVLVRTDFPPDAAVDAGSSAWAVTVLSLACQLPRPPSLRRLVAAVPDGAARPDVLAALLGRTGEALLVDRRGGAPQRVPCDLRGAGLRLLLTELGEPSAGSTAPTRPDRADQITDQITDGLTDRVHRAAVALRSGDLTVLGAALTESFLATHARRHLPAPLVDAVLAALHAGARGAGLLGAGPLDEGRRPAVVALAAAEDVASVRAALHAARRPPAPPPRIIVATASVPPTPPAVPGTDVTSSEEADACAS